MKKNIQFTNKSIAHGGPGTFQTRITSFLKDNNYKVTSSEDRSKPDLLFIISSTRKYFWIIKNKIKGKKVIQRLDGYLWKHKFEKRSLYFKIKCELMNLNMAFIRKYIANHIIYQSEYIKLEWEKRYGALLKDFSIIHNAASEDFFKDKINYDIKAKFRIVCVEGAIQGDKLTIAILKRLEEIVKVNPSIDKIDIYGDDRQINKRLFNENLIDFKGVVSRDSIHKIYNKKNIIFFVLEINPPCPNSLIESICARIPSIGFDTGSYSELAKNTGISMKYNKNKNSLDIPDLKVIDDAIDTMIKNYSLYAKNTFSISDIYKLERMGKEYLNIIINLT